MAGLNLFRPGNPRVSTSLERCQGFPTTGIPWMEEPLGPAVARAVMITVQATTPWSQDGD